MDYVKAFLVGGLFCLIGQVLIDKTKLTPARILVCYVVVGVFLGAVGVYQQLVEFAGAGATVPLTGFGNTLAKGVKEAVDKDGFITLTEEGKTLSEQIYQRHNLLTRLLVELGVPEEIAAEDACKMEHVISPETFDAIKKHFEQQ